MMASKDQNNVVVLGAVSIYPSDAERSKDEIRVDSRVVRKLVSMRVNPFVSDLIFMKYFESIYRRLCYERVSVLPRGSAVVELSESNECKRPVLKQGGDQNSWWPTYSRNTWSFVEEARE